MTAGLSTRLKNALLSHFDCDDVTPELVASLSMYELRHDIMGVGPICAREAAAWVAAHGLTLAPDPLPWLERETIERYTAYLERHGYTVERAALNLARPRWLDLCAELRRYFDSGTLDKASDLYLLLCEVERAD